MEPRPRRPGAAGVRSAEMNSIPLVVAAQQDAALRAVLRVILEPQLKVRLSAAPFSPKGAQS